MPASNVPQGLLGFNLDDLNKILPPVVTEAIKDTVGSILGNEPGTPSIGDPQPAGPPPIPVKPGSTELNNAVKAIDVVLGALDLLFKFSFLIPAQYESTLRALAGALRTIRGWLD